MNVISECSLMFREFKGNFQNTGSVLPSSRFLARRMLDPFSKRRQAAHILEVGAGTGPITEQIVERLRPRDTLHIVELNAEFIRHLRERVNQDPVWRDRKAQIHIFHADILKFEHAHEYDYVVCSLPFYNFPPSLVRGIFAKMRHLLKPGGVLSYFEYAAMRSLGGPFMSRDRRHNMRQIEGMLQEQRAQCLSRSELVLPNVPPAWVRHLTQK
ncbi:MAG: methyltransferase domain-containing protein [Verrucomicrobiae bacterium]|nr:methyltransferase domain-containing protein [Verrucomicrobiae bacterium]